jgi:hypothetical protein
VNRAHPHPPRTPRRARLAAAALAALAHLAELRARGVTSLDIVAHSMGGLLARDVLTRPHPHAIPAVPVLITLGTPHAGSPWAGFQPVAEIREHLQRWIESDDQDPARLFVAWHDGLGQAREDLRPDSPYLKDLNNRPWPDTTRLIAVVGVIGAYDPDDDPGDRATLTAKLGDGVVPTDSAATPLASETLFVRANHRSLIRAVELDAWAHARFGLTPPPTPPAIPLILDRLTPPPPRPPSPFSASPSLPPPTPPLRDLCALCVQKILS